MIGVVVGIGDKYYNMAERAKKSVLDHTPLNEVKIIQEFDKPLHPSYAPIFAFDMFDCDSVFVFDADTYMVRDWDVNQYDRFTAVKDKQKSLMLQECEEWDLDPDKYVNGGMWIANRERHKSLLEDVQELSLSEGYDSTFYEQTALNKAIQDSQTEVNYLPRRYNVIGAGKHHTEIPEDAVMLHAAGGNNKSGFEDLVESYE